MKIKALSFPFEINEETTAKFLNELSTTVNDYSNIVIYVTCSGGSFSDSEKIIDFINRFKDKIELVFSWSVNSAAVDLVMNSECKKTVLDSAFCVIHIGSNDIDYRAYKKKDPVERFVVHDLVESNEKQIKETSRYFQLTEKEIEKFTNGENIVVKNDRLKKAVNRNTNERLQDYLNDTKG